MTVVLLMLLIALSLPGCGSSGVGQGDPDITGAVTEVHLGTPVSGSEGTIMVRGSGDGGEAAANVNVTTATEVIDRRETPEQETDITACRNAKQVQVWFEGPVMESYPIQATAKRIVIVR